MLKVVYLLYCYSRHGSVHHKRSLSTKKKAGSATAKSGHAQINHAGAAAKTGHAQVNHGFSKETTVIHEDATVTTGDNITKQDLIAETNIPAGDAVIPAEPNAIPSEPKAIPTETKSIPIGPTVTAKEGDVYLARNGDLQVSQESIDQLANERSLAAGPLIATAGKITH